MSETACKFPSCDRPRITKGLCDAHYRQHRLGKELTPVRPHGGSVSKAVAPRLLAKREIDEHTGCWIWQGPPTQSGYGQMYVKGRVTRVHRAAYETWVGKIPVGETVHHKCAQRLCINPEHLQLATVQENVAEMHARQSFQRRIDHLTQRVQQLEALLAANGVAIPDHLD